ncbi:hypothetical protein [Listeria booriae]|nr:hypothetical protein [Listeria booriae]
MKNNKKLSIGKGQIDAEPLPFYFSLTGGNPRFLTRPQKQKKSMG